MNRLPQQFFQRDVLEVAPDLLGNYLVRSFGDKQIKHKITEVEAYRGAEDLACHASKGRTKRTEIMFNTGGFVYMYLIYGMHWMLNIVTAGVNIPQAVLIRGIEGFNGPGRVSRYLQLDKSFYGENLEYSTRIWIEKNSNSPSIKTSPRIGIDYAGEPWISKAWRYLIE